MELNKQQTIFYLNRLLRELEPKAVDHVAAAHRCVSYAERRRLVEQSNQPVGEVLALRQAIDLLGNLDQEQFDVDDCTDEEAKVV